MGTVKKITRHNGSGYYEGGISVHDAGRKIYVLWFGLERLNRADALNDAARMRDAILEGQHVG